MTTEEFISRLDRFFDREDMIGAGEFLRSARREAEQSGDTACFLPC